MGLDYSHATGHGVGAYLNVHEEPPMISAFNREPGMCKNMFTSNEPGYYEEHKFGIRLEDVLQGNFKIDQLKSNIECLYCIRIE